MSFDYNRWKESQLNPVEEETASSVPFPLSIRLAGIIWATVGSLIVMSMVWLSLQVGTVPSPRRLLVGVGIIFVGFVTAGGCVASTAKMGIMSIVLGFFWICFGILSLGHLGVQPNGMLTVLCSCGIGGALLLGGYLAVTGNSSYQKWRNANVGGGWSSRGM
jgi:hypothetical protein